MTPRERMLRTLQGQAADRVPLDLPGLLCASREKVEAIRDPLRLQIAERAFDETAFRVGVASRINRHLVTPPQRYHHDRKELPDGHAETHGIIDTPEGEVTFVTRWNPDANTTWTVKYPVENKDDIRKIASVPWELPAGLEPPDLGSLPDEFASRGLLVTSISSPFVCVAGMMTYESFLELCATDLALVEELTEICRQRVLDCLRVLLSRPGIEIVWMGGSEWVMPPMGSPAL